MSAAMRGGRLLRSPISHDIPAIGKARATTAPAPYKQHSLHTLALGTILMVVTLFAAIGCSGEGTVPSMEDQALAINRSLMCPVCPGETLDQSQVELAQQMRAIIREKLAQGERPEVIRQFFVDRYGLGVLAAPPRKGFQMTVWVVPLVVVAAGGLLVVMALRHLSSHQQTRRQEESEEATGPYLARVDQELLERRQAGPGKKGTEGG